MSEDFEVVDNPADEVVDPTDQHQEEMQLEEEADILEVPVLAVEQENRAEDNVQTAEETEEMEREWMAKVERGIFLFKIVLFGYLFGIIAATITIPILHLPFTVEDRNVSSSCEGLKYSGNDTHFEYSYQVEKRHFNRHFLIGRLMFGVNFEQYIIERGKESDDAFVHRQRNVLSRLDRMKKLPGFMVVEQYTFNGFLAKMFGLTEKCYNKKYRYEVKCEGLKEAHEKWKFAADAKREDFTQKLINFVANM